MVSYFTQYYLPVVIFAAVALTIPVALVLISKFLMIRKPNPVKCQPYECGIQVENEAYNFRFSIRYLIIAILFVIFDVETVFLFPWAVRFDQLGLFGLVEVFIFLFILIVGYIYAFKEGALEWF